MSILNIDPILINAPQCVKAYRQAIKALNTDVMAWSHDAVYFAYVEAKSLEYKDFKAAYLTVVSRMYNEQCRVVQNELYLGNGSNVAHL